MNTAETIKVCDIIMPPARELSLWMRRDAAHRGLNEDALHLTVTEIYEGKDKAGRWLWFATKHTPEWDANKVRPYTFTFKARPATPWTIIKRP